MAGERERGGRERSRDREERDSEFVDKLVHINRVAKVVKGGKRFGFAALVVIGDQKGRVGFGHGKAREVPEAIRKATESAKRNLTRVALREGRTLHHDIAGRHGAGRPAREADLRRRVRGADVAYPFLRLLSAGSPVCHPADECAHAADRPVHPADPVRASSSSLPSNRWMSPRGVAGAAMVTRARHEGSRAAALSAAVPPREWPISSCGRG